jgi:2-iminoacetate synthase
MGLAKSGEIQNVCLPNALLTFKEYLIDYADEPTRAVGEVLLKETLASIPEDSIRTTTIERLKEIEAGRRDLYF